MFSKFSTQLSLATLVIEMYTRVPILAHTDDTDNEVLRYRYKDLFISTKKWPRPVLVIRAVYG
jgi:hypothetical protein